MSSWTSMGWIMSTPWVAPHPGGGENQPPTDRGDGVGRRGPGSHPLGGVAWRGVRGEFIHPHLVHRVACHQVPLRGRHMLTPAPNNIALLCAIHTRCLHLRTCDA